MKKRTKKTTKNQNLKNPSYKFYYWLTGIILLLALVFFFRTTFTMYYFIIKGKFEEREYGYKNLEKLRPESEALKIHSIINRYRSHAIGIDISQHQGNIAWDSVKYIKNDIPISFVFVRATRGAYVQDAFFRKNWTNLKNKNLLRGAYHYYDVNRNSTDQAENFMKTVTLEKGDLPPVLDIEELPKNQSLELLKKGITNWLHLIEKQYQVKPIIYSNDAYFIHHIADMDLTEYPIWVANYNPRNSPKHSRWSFWQFSEKGIIKGITSNFVDINIFNGNTNQLEKLTIK
ncbi:GH25 family lysozyme [Apibacter raozihei]|uniref:glycoside hydrolase family 25 protein n=1 Tax=Apibacter raozihei TaxID=2500547 RepID=UPI000FE43745|nr:GH25 family lysozyme [Apibacter raozihei]